MLEIIVKFWDQIKFFLLMPATAIAAWLYKRRQEKIKAREQEINLMKANIGKLQDDMSQVHKDLEQGNKEFSELRNDLKANTEIQTETNMKLQKVLGYLEGKREA